jgi:hypothetical protein
VALQSMLEMRAVKVCTLRGHMSLICAEYNYLYNGVAMVASDQFHTNPGFGDTVHEGSTLSIMRIGASQCCDGSEHRRIGAP